MNHHHCPPCDGDGTTRLVSVGYWRNIHSPRLPHPAEVPASESDEEQDEADLVAWYVGHGLVSHDGGLAPWDCHLCGEVGIGSVDLTDGTYEWPQGLAHYVARHRVRLPREFVEHVKRTARRLVSAKREVDWWAGTERV